MSGAAWSAVGGKPAPSPSYKSPESQAPPPAGAAPASYGNYGSAPSPYSQPAPVAAAPSAPAASVNPFDMF